MEGYKVLAINPGSTSTKISVYRDEKEILVKTLRHTSEELKDFNSISDQMEFRKKIVESSLVESGISPSELSAVVGRGGLLKPISGGTYHVNETMLKDLTVGVMGEHASNLGGRIAHIMAEENNIPAYIVDPVVVDEMKDVARVSGVPELERKSIFHALNQKAVARKYAREIGAEYEELNLIVVHMGGGVSVGAHENGRVIDVNNALDGDGPFSPERAGGVPAGDLVKMAVSGKYELDYIKKRLKGNGGLVGYLGTTDVRDVLRMIEEGDAKAKLVFDAMIYQIAKEIGGFSASLKGRVDAILLTGGIAYSEIVVAAIRDYVEYIAQVRVYPGEDEMAALTEGALRVLRGEEKSKEYK